MVRYSGLCKQHVMQKSAMAMAIVAIPVAPPLGTSLYA